MRGRPRQAAAAAGAIVAFCLAVGVTAAPAELVERGNLFVRFDGGISPSALPRDRLAPIAISVEGTVRTLSGARPPALRAIRIELNRGGRLDTTGLPVCRYRQIVAASTTSALAACRDSLVGRGTYAASTAFPDQTAFPLEGAVLAFNSRSRGRETILAHVFGVDPLPMTRIVVFRVERSKGTYGTILSGKLPRSSNRHGYVEAISLRFFRRYSHRGEIRSYVSAACSAPEGFFSAFFPFARTSMTFADGRTLSSTLVRSCRVRSAER